MSKKRGAIDVQISLLRLTPVPYPRSLPREAGRAREGARFCLYSFPHSLNPSFPEITRFLIPS